MTPGRSFHQERLQKGHIPVDGRRRLGLEVEAACALFADPDPWESVQGRPRLTRREEEPLHRVGVLPVPKELGSDVLGMRPGPLQLPAPILRIPVKKEGIGWEQLQKRTIHGRTGRVPSEIHRQKVGCFQRPNGPLIQDVEGPERGDLVPPKLHPKRFRRTE